MPKLISQRGFVAPLVIIFILIAIIIAGLVVYITVLKGPLPNFASQTSTISGIIDLNGVTPSGSTIAIGERKVGEKDFNIIVSNLPAKDLVNWSWNGASVNSVYEIQAYLQNNGQNVASSGINVLTAPAMNEVLTINAV